jgi:hypothetical protein
MKPAKYHRFFRVKFSRTGGEIGPYRERNLPVQENFLGRTGKKANY